ncbi:MAG: hypothetical protein KDL87_09340 [Verrucomicrobiae bacterium]|nr:hypothetical protein [Verrucomicrobiae bacterium]
MNKNALSLITQKPASLGIPGLMASQASKSPGGTGASKAATAKGPWGRLEQFPFFLEAPAHLLDRFPLPNPKPRWFVNSSEASQALDRMSRSGMPPEILHAINQPANRAFHGDQIVFFPPPAALLKLDCKTRTSIYRELRRYPANADIVGPVLIPNNNVEEWFANTQIRPELIQLIKQMSYPRGDALAFSDISVLMGFVKGEAEARALVSVLTRTRTLMLKLVLDSNSKLTETKNYWSAGGQRKGHSSTSLIQAMIDTQDGEKLDIVHLLPPLPRRLLYTYADLSSVVEGEMPDCHWSSLNFFNSHPEPFYLEARLAASAFTERLIPIKPPFKFGDTIVFLDNQKGNAFHSCVYLADDVVFTKNGRNLLSPWVLQTMEHVRKTYLFENNGRIQGYRARESGTV